jgi:hypothetical protein
MDRKDTATFIKIQQLRLFMDNLGLNASEAGKLFKDNGVFDYIDDAYEFLHIQGKYATYEDVSNYIACRKVKA